MDRKVIFHQNIFFFDLMPGNQLVIIPRDRRWSTQAQKVLRWIMIGVFFWLILSYHCDDEMLPNSFDCRSKSFL